MVADRGAIGLSAAEAVESTFADVGAVAQTGSVRSVDDDAFGRIFDSLLRFDGERDNVYLGATSQAVPAAGTIQTIGQFMMLHRPHDSAPVFGPRKWAQFEHLLAVLDREVILEGI